MQSPVKELGDRVLSLVHNGVGTGYNPVPHIEKAIMECVDMEHLQKCEQEERLHAETLKLRKENERLKTVVSVLADRLKGEV